MTTSKTHLQAMCRRLALAPLRICKSRHTCTFCAQQITVHEQYREAGIGARAHVICFETVNREVHGRTKS